MVFTVMRQDAHQHGKMKPGNVNGAGVSSGPKREISCFAMTPVQSHFTANPLGTGGVNRFPKRKDGDVMLIPSKVIKGLAKTASKDPARYQLCGIHVARNGVSEAVSTNGKILGHVEYKEPDQDEYPAVVDLGERREKFSFTIPTEPALDIAKVAEKAGRGSRPILGNVAIKETEEESTTISSTDLETTATRKVENKGSFPDYHRVMEFGPAISKLDVGILKQACEAIIAIHGKDVCVDVLYKDKTWPVAFQVRTDDMKTTVMVMPLVES